MEKIEQFIKLWRSGCQQFEAHTSGSTGTPKSIMLNRADMIQSARATNQFFGITKNSTLGLPLSVNYIAGKMMVVRTEIAGCKLLPLPISNDVIIRQHVDLLSVVPSQIPSILSSSQYIDNLLIGGAPINSQSEHALIDAGIKAYLGYGMTETCSHVALRRIGNDGRFTAMPGITFATDSRDCLIIQSAYFSWKSLVTNDVVEILSDTEFKWLGRADNVINSGGIKIHPESLEQTYRQLIPELPDFYLVGITSDKWGSELAMVTQPIHQHLLEELKAKVTDHKYLPKKIITVHELATTANGKVRRIVPSDYISTVEFD